MIAGENIILVPSTIVYYVNLENELFDWCSSGELRNNERSLFQFFSKLFHTTCLEAVQHMLLVYKRTND